MRFACFTVVVPCTIPFSGISYAQHVFGYVNPLLIFGVQRVAFLSSFCLISLCWSTWRCSISKCLSVFGWKHLTPATTRFLVQNVSFRAIFRDFLGSNSSLSFVTEAGLKFSTWRPRIGVGIRFGEASHPGPSSRRLAPTSCRFCIVNPTCLCKKQDIFKDLISETKSHVVAVAETAATIAMQKSFNRSMVDIGFQNLWCPPVSPQLQSVNSLELERGKASGVLLSTSVPCRHSRVNSPDDWALSTRVVHGVLQIGQSHIQVFVVYGRPSSYLGASRFNNDLLEYCLQQAALTPIPFVILGDWNQPIDTLPSWPELEQKGFRHLSQLYEKQIGRAMPPTCQGISVIDSAIFSPQLCGLVKNIQVLSSKWFATHSPVVFDIDIQGPAIFVQKFRMPKQLVDFSLEPQELESAFCQLQPNSTSTIEAWGETFENVVAHALSQRDPPQVLPASYKGRCKPPRLTKTPVMSPVRKASQGDYNPTCEVITISSRRKVKQLRRLQSLCQRLRKFEKCGASTDSTLKELSQEWLSVLRCRAFGEDFLFWAQYCCCLPPPDFPFSTHAWLFDLCQLVKFQVEADLAQDEKIFRQSIEYARHLDKKDNHNQRAFQQVKGPSLPPIRELQTFVEDDVLINPGDSDNTAEIFGNHVGKLSSHFPVVVNDIPCRVLEVASDWAVIEHPLDFDNNGEASIRQQQFAISPPEIARLLSDQWNPIWQDEESTVDFFDDGHILELVQALPPHPQIEVDMTDPKLWTSAIRKLKHKAARGIDSISALELSLLPEQMVCSLSETMCQYKSGFPHWFMTGIVSPLPKGASLSPSAIRPITVLAQLYRLWASVAASAIIPILATWMPPSVTGLLPGRGSADAAIVQQFHLERAHFLNQHASGLVLDLRKCFNCIKWTLGFPLVKHCGLPIDLIQQWAFSLQSLHRVWKITGNIFEAGPTSRGFPEGDVLSVIVMICLAGLWCCYVSQSCNSPALALSAYADNWSWSLTDHNLHALAMTSTNRILQAGGLVIDWSKTWFWVTHSDDAPLVSSLLTPFAPEGQLKNRTSAPDLGYQMQYTKKASLGIITDRIEAGLKRLSRLSFMPHDLSTREHLVRVSIFPCMFYGVECRPIAVDQLHKIRSRTCDALLGSSRSSTPAFALLLTSKGILDPAHWILVKTVLSIRRFLHLHPELQSDFFKMTSNFNGTLNQVRGPASALSWQLGQISWTCDNQGLLLVGAHTSISLLLSSQSRIKRFLDLAWQQDLIRLHTTRWSLRGLPDISRCATVLQLQFWKNSRITKGPTCYEK